MGGEKKRDAFIAATVDDTLQGLEDLLPPDAMRAVRARLEDDLVAHPVLSKLAHEHAPRKIVARSDEVPTGPEVLAKLAAIAKANRHG